MVSWGRITADLNVFACEDDDARGENSLQGEREDEEEVMQRQSFLCYSLKKQMAADSCSQ